MKTTNKYFLFTIFALSFVGLFGMEEKGQESPEYQGILERSQATERLFKAVLLGNAEAITQLVLHERADINSRNNQGFTPLHIAIERNDGPVLITLLGLGADVNVRDLQAQQVLTHLGYCGNPWWARLHLGTLTPLEYAILLFDRTVKADERSKRLEIVKFLISSGIELNPQGVPLTPLHVASTLYSGKCLIDLLIEHGAYVNLKNSMGIMPCQLAITYANFDNVSSLLAYGTNVNEPNINGHTMLATALFMLKSRLGFPEINKILFDLLSFGAHLDDAQINELLSLPNVELLNDPFINAVIRGNQREACEKLICNAGLTEETLQKYFLLATGQGNIPLIKFMLRVFGRKISQGIRNMAFLRVAQIGNEEALAYFHSSFTIADDIMELAFVLSARACQLDTLEYLYNTGRISAQTIQVVAEQAFEWGNINIWLYLYSLVSDQQAHQTQSAALEPTPDRSRYLI